MVIGCAAGLLAVKIYLLGLALLGAFGAFSAWQCFVALFPHAVPDGGLYTLLALVLLAGTILAMWMEKWMLLFATPVVGTFMLSQGLSRYLHDDSLRLNVFAIVHGDAACTDDRCLGVYAGFAGLALVGLLVQWYVTSGLRSGKGKSLLG